MYRIQNQYNIQSVGNAFRLQIQDTDILGWFVGHRLHLEIRRGGARFRLSLQGWWTGVALIALIMYCYLYF